MSVNGAGTVYKQSKAEVKISNESKKECNKYIHGHSGTYHTVLSSNCSEKPKLLVFYDKNVIINVTSLKKMLR